MCCASSEQALAVKPTGIGHDWLVSACIKLLQECEILPLSKEQLALDDGVEGDDGGAILATEDRPNSSDGGEVEDQDGANLQVDELIQDPLYLRAEPVDHDHRNFAWEPFKFHFTYTNSKKTIRALAPPT